MNNRKYIVPEIILLRLLARDSELGYLEAAGVDNWSYYGEGREKYIKEVLEIPNDLSDKEDLDFIDIAKIKIMEYNKIEEDDLK